MAYQGQISAVYCGQGGVTGARNIDDIQPSMMLADTTRNLVLNARGRRKRGGTKITTAGADVTGRVMGVFDCTFRNGTQYIIVASDDGKIWADGGDPPIATGMGTTLPYSFAFGENKLFIADGVSSPQVWTGAGSVAEIANPASDWAAAPPFQFLMHGRGASQRMCALNSTTIYFSKNYASAGDMEEFVTDSESLYIDTGDGVGLIGMVEIGEEVVVFGRDKAYRIDDSSTDTADWGVVPAQWDGGAANWRLIIKTPNDAICMAEDGEVYSVVAVASYGDYMQASLTKDSWMHDWIKENIRLSYISHFHGLYDPAMRAVVIWVVRNGKTECDTALLYYIDRLPAEAWMIHNNDGNPSGYDASAAGRIKNNTSGSYQIYTGGYDGDVWALNQETRADNGLGYYGGFTSPNSSLGESGGAKFYDALHVYAEPQANCLLSVRVVVDGVSKATKYFDLSGTGAKLGVFMLDTDFLVGDQALDVSARLGFVGKRIQYEFFSANVDEDFFVTGYATHFKPMGIPRR